jgi:hypothetical protein
LAVKQGVDAQVKWEKDDMLLPTTKIHNKLFDALFAWPAR